MDQETGDAAPMSDYQRDIRDLSEQIVEAQMPIRILDEIKWDAQVQETFFARGCREQPAVDRAWYEQHPLSFDPVEKRKQLHSIEREVTRRLGQLNPVSVMMRRMCREYQLVVRMLEARGTADFANLSQELLICTQN